MSLTAPTKKALILEATPRLRYRPTAPPAQSSCAGVKLSPSPACRALPSQQPGTARTAAAAAPLPPTRAARLRTPPGAWRKPVPRSAATRHPKADPAVLHAAVAAPSSGRRQRRCPQRERRRRRRRLRRWFHLARHPPSARWSVPFRDRRHRHCRFRAHPSRGCLRPPPVHHCPATMRQKQLQQQQQQQYRA
ncbi:unnamed protein product, partial [Ectocarpus fasciculatus]